MSELSPDYSAEQQAKVAEMLRKFVNGFFIVDAPGDSPRVIVAKSDVERAGLYEIEDSGEVDQEVIIELLDNGIHPELN